MPLQNTCAFLNMGTSEFFIVIVGLALLFAVANYGRNTSLGLFGSLLLALITSPLIAFFIIYIFFKKNIGVAKKGNKKLPDTSAS